MQNPPPNNSDSGRVTYTFTGNPTIRCDAGYIKTAEGLTKISIQLLCLGSLIAARTTDIRHTRIGDYYISVASASMTYIGLMNAMYNFHVCEKFHKFPWLQVEVFAGMIHAGLYLIAGILALIEAPGITVAGVFAFVCTAAFAYEVLRKFTAFNNGELAQGSRQMVQAVNQTPC